jgi:hypothetical protein
VEAHDHGTEYERLVAQIGELAARARERGPSTVANRQLERGK